MANENSIPPPGATVIWERVIDEAAQAKRIKRLLNWYAFPSLAIIVVGAVLGGFGAAAGLLILFGLFGALLGGWVFMLNLNERSLTKLWVTDGVLHQTRNKGIPLAQVNEFSVSQSTDNSDTGVDAVTATFLAKGVLLEWMKWPSMPSHHMPGVVAALESVLPGKSISPDEMTRRLRE
jgi:hypothetical protein